uniref:EGF-like domain-containing protein n=1 Tax=Sexangularia sp. CB-2014 TaxID=1486929 RepID=A0A7S1VA14_9EUKA
MARLTVSLPTYSLPTDGSMFLNGSNNTGSMVTPPFVVAVAAVAVGDEIRLSSPSSGMRTVAWFGTPPNRSTTNVFAWSCIGGSCAWRVRSIANPVPSDSPADDLIVSGNGSRVLYLEIYGSIGDGVSISHTSDEPSSDLLRDCAEEQFACVRGVCKTDGHCACPLGFRGRTCSLAPTEAVPDHEIPVEFASELSTAFFRIEEPRGASAALYLSSPFVQVLVGVEPILSLNEAVSVGYSQVPSEVTIKTVMDGDESLQRMRLPNVNGTLFLTLMYHESLADDGTSAEAPPFPHAFTIRLDAGSDNGSGVNWTLLVVMIALAAFGAAMIACTLRKRQRRSSRGRGGILGYLDVSTAAERVTSPASSSSSRRRGRRGAGSDVRMHRRRVDRV